VSKSSRNKPIDPSTLSFEQALEQVEAIIERIERGEVGLEDSLAEYERGVLLIQHCRRIHKDAVQRVDDLTARLMPDNARPGTPEPHDEDGDDDPLEA
jgi:exodeoxyribonuclease VII small subunit